MKTCFFIFGVLTAASSVLASLDKCIAGWEALSEPPSIHISHQGDLNCYQDAKLVVEAMGKNPSFEMDKVNVLYLSKFQGFGMHAVVEYRGFVYDATGPEIRPIPAVDYFAPPDSRPAEVRRIPGSEYREKFNKGPGYFGAGMKEFALTDPERAPLPVARARYPLMSLADFLEIMRGSR